MIEVNNCYSYQLFILADRLWSLTRPLKYKMEVTIPRIVKAFIAGNILSFIVILTMMLQDSQNDKQFQLCFLVRKSQVVICVIWVKSGQFLYFFLYG